MVLNISISRKAEEMLKTKAAAAGVDVGVYASRQLELLASSNKTLRELSGESGEAFLASGESDEELGEFLEKEKHAMRRERREKNP